MCAVAPPGRFTRGTDELCGGRHSASRHGCCTRCISPSAVCTTANDDTRTRPSRCPSLASIRPCTLRATVNCMPRDISGGGSSFGTAASCTCRVVGFIICQMQGAGGGNYTIEQRAAATDAIHRAAPCAVAPPGQLTPGSDESHSTMHPASWGGASHGYYLPGALSRKC